MPLSNFRGEKSGISRPTRMEDRRIRRSKKLIQEAFLSLLTEKGYTDVSIQDILDRADVGRTTFYTYYRSKEDLMFHGFSDFEQSFEIPSDLVRDPVTGAGGEFARALFEHIAEQRPTARALLGERGVPAIAEHLESLLKKRFQNTWAKDWKELGHSTAVIESAAVFAAGAFMSTLRFWLMAARPSLPSEAYDLYLKILVPGIRELFKSPEKMDSRRRVN